jgi:hypothetical protein
LPSITPLKIMCRLVHGCAIDPSPISLHSKGNSRLWRSGD